jgi:hypothetical protein
MINKKPATKDLNTKPEVKSTRKVAVKKPITTDVEKTDKVIIEVPENKPTAKSTVKAKVSPAPIKVSQEIEPTTTTKVNDELPTTEVVVEISRKDLIKKIKKDIKIDKKKIKELLNDIKKDRKNIKKESKSKKKK